MKLTTLKTTLDHAKHFLTNQDFIAVLQHFAFDGESVTAFNDIQACRLKLDTDLQCTIPGNLLIRLLSTLNTEVIDIKENKTKTHVDIISGKNKTKLPMLPLEDFVFTLPETTEAPITLTPDVIEGIRKCLISVSANPTRPEFNGINFIIERDSLKLYSSDGKTISRYTLDDKFSVEATEQIQSILPSFFCEKLTTLHPALVGKTANVECQFDTQWVTANLDGNFLFTRVIDRKPPDCEGAILTYAADADKLLMWEIPSELESILDRAVLFLDAQNGINESEFAVTGNEVRVHTASVLGTSTDTFNIPIDLGKFTFAVDPNLMLRAFRICKKMTLKPNVVILQNENFLHLISTKSQ